MDFLACRIFEENGRAVPRLVTMPVDDLSPGEVVIRAEWSGVNFKDALAITGKGKILRRFPLNAGIDVAGVVDGSTDPRYREGDRVLVNGMGLGEAHDGGLAGRVRVPADWIVPLPEGLTTFEAMALGTAGFSAGLAIERMETLGQRPDKGPIAVTGASGGVGSIAVAILARLGYRVVAVSGRREHHGYLAELGAQEVVTPDDLALGTRPLESVRFGGAVDNVGGDLLAGIVRHVGLWGSVAVIGNAASPKLETTVFPLILRGVNFVGVSSANCPMDLRTEVWRRLGGAMKPPHLDTIVFRTARLDGVIAEADAVMDRRARGRIVIDCGAGS